MKILKYGEILKKNKMLGDALSTSNYSVGVLSNVTVNQLKELLEFTLRTEGVNAKVFFGDYDAVVQDSKKFESFQAVILFWEAINFAPHLHGEAYLLGEKELNEIQQKIEDEIRLVLKNLKDVPLVLINKFTISLFNSNPLKKDPLDLLCHRLNNFVESIISLNQIIVDLDLIIAHVGAIKSLDSRQFIAAKSIYSVDFFRGYVEAISPAFMATTGRYKKVLVLDCDNTLWGGIAGEDGLEGIELGSSSVRGQIYSDIQRMIIGLKHEGVLLAICSKNNPDDVMTILKSHPEMLISDNILVSKKINWEDKATNIRQIALDLNLGLDSFVFLDDSSFEIGLVSKELPEVRCIQVPNTLSEYPNVMRKLRQHFFTPVRTSEDVKKTEMYLEESLRKKRISSYSNMEDYLSSLCLRVSIIWDKEIPIPRASQMSQKTNQFNLTTKRYSETDIARMLDSIEFQLAVFSVEDNYGDYGVTGMSIIQIKDSHKSTAVIDTFLMSCRVISRNIEFSFFDEIVKKLASIGITKIVGEYVVTNKNMQVANFYEVLGFLLESDQDGIKKYSIPLSEYKPHSLRYIEIN